MRLSITKSKNATSLYVIQSVYENGHRSTRVVEKLGTVAELEKKLNGKDPIEWAKAYIVELNKKEKEQTREVLVKFAPAERIPTGQQRQFNGGYLFLQRLYHDLGLHDIASDIAEKYKFTYDMNSILSRLLYGRVLFPSSKLSTFEQSQKLLEQPSFDLQHIYRALEVISKETDFIQSTVYKNSLNLSKRNTGVLYYDCTNYFFEIEQESGLKQYGASKEHRPNPIVQMGLFMDGDGIPLAFNLNCGNTNEQITLKPLEEKILSDFNLSKFVVCTDAGLASESNRQFNDTASRAFITTQSIKKLKKHLKEWALNPSGWKLNGHKETFNVDSLDETVYKDVTFYKERWINENGFEQKLVVTYSLKYRDYQRTIRASQTERAIKAIESNPKKISKNNPNDYRRLIKKTKCTEDGEVADKEIFSLDQDAIAAEEAFDGFYAICTNLEDEAQDIIKINQRRWEIEECFRIMKTEFKARPVYLSRDDRIKAHFMICFLALVLFRFLENKLDNKFTCNEIVTCLRDMNFLKLEGEGFVPTYTRTDLTDALHETFGFHTDHQIVTNAMMKKFQKETKK